MTLNFVLNNIIYFTLLLLLINANNDRFAVLCNPQRATGDTFGVSF